MSRTPALLEPARRRRTAAYAAGPTLDHALEAGHRLAAHGLASTIGYTAMAGQSARSVADEHLTAFERLASQRFDCYVSVKLSALDFDAGLFAELAATAARTGRALHLDALAPETVDMTWRLLQSAPPAAQLGVALPGCWARSPDDASLAVRRGLRVRVVKGQWADGAGTAVDPAEGFLQVVDRLRGHRAGVAVATHDDGLLAASLQRLTAAGTPCSAELFFGLPFRAPAEIALRLGVPIRVYVPYGRAAAPYAVAGLRHDPAVARWLIQDLLLGKEKMWRSIRRSSVPV
jgi:proline dehydrogenase